MTEPGENQIKSRKADHIRVNLEEDVKSGLTTGFENYHFLHQALPELDFIDIDLHQELFGTNLNSPFLISSMTGGVERAESINTFLAIAAQEKKIALGLGSQRAALEYDQLKKSFQVVRKFAPDVLLFANVGAVQLNYVDFCRRAIEMVSANALFLHLNPLQEALQPEGDTRFGGLLEKIEKLTHVLNIPVVVKEVGWGISGETARKLANAGVAAIDVAGAGGTSWAMVEKFRMNDEMKRRVADNFRDWGIPTAESIVQVHHSVPELSVFASGGVRNGVEAAKCLALGACLVGSAAPFLKAAMVSAEEVVKTIEEFEITLKITMFSSGAKDLASLEKNGLKYTGR
ncbi:MAG: type 2 isopentenyl-diphosphate Delta-isomerase [Anaerolineae bacterium]|nr:type 2 isopentenyl-diphosphate Delta-isomerase [Anaerolineae bacterium]